MDKIQFTFEDENGTVEFYILDQTRISGKNYLLVSESMEEAEVLILKDTAPQESLESVYEIVENEIELQAVAKVFEETMGDIKFERED